MFKSIFSLFASVALVCAANAQVIIAEGGNEHTYYLDQGFTTDCHLIFKNNTGKTTVFAYSQVYSDFPVGKWAVSFCDNRNCFPDLVQEDSFAAVQKDATTEFKISVDPQGKTDTAKVQYAIYDRANPSVRDTLTFNFIVQWGAGLHEANLNAAAVYPNPAKDIIHLAGLSTATEVRIYASDSRLAGVYNIGSAENTLNIADLPKGLYFVSYNADNRLVRSSFVKQ